MNYDLLSSPEENEKCNQWIGLLESDASAFEFKTSGSTGAPKAMWFTREQIETSVYLTQKALNLSFGSRFLLPLSMDYVAAKMMVARAFFLKGELLLIPNSANPFKDVPIFDGVHLCSLVPRQVDQILKQETSVAQLNKIEKLLIGGADIDISLEKKLMSVYKGKAYHTYGMTETLTHIALREMGVSNNSKEYVTLSGVKVRADQANCLSIWSPVNEVWIETNDMVELTSIGFIWKGRRDFVINSGGYKIHPEIVEAALSVISPYKPAIVFGLANSLWGEKCVVISSAAFTEEEKLKLAQMIHSYEIPKDWFTGKICYLENGKLDRIATKREWLKHQTII